jgi:hypothetical protein
MRRLFAILAACILASIANSQPVAPPVPADKPDATEQMDLKPAMAAAEAWLKLVDDGLYGSSWEQAATLFKDKVVKLQWETGLQEQRNLVGTLASRKLASATYTRALPGAPAGEYVVIQYHSRFDNRPLATEIVTPMRQPDGSWRVAGYFIR